MDQQRQSQHNEKPQRQEFVSGDTKASQQLKRNKERIEKIWEKRVRELVVESRGVTSLVLVNSIPIFLDKLADVLDLENPATDATIGNTMAIGHGGDRAGLANYNLPQLLKEFSILREVCTDVLQEEGVLTFEVRNAIDRSIDSAISLAASEFTRVQSLDTRSALYRAELSNRDLEQFAAVAAHDLKSPLATISGYLDLLSDEVRDKLDEEQNQYIDVIRAASNRMRNLIDSLLDYARLTKSDKPFQAVDINDVVAGSLQNLANLLEKAGAQVFFRSLPVVMGNADLLTQVFQNLISNSIKFHSSETPKIQINAQEKNGYWCFALKDNGIGFDPKEKENIFSLYKKLHGASEYPGVGIGLATCRRVIELHGGEIWADSQPGNGSTFYFTIPKNGYVSH